MCRFRSTRRALGCFCASVLVLAIVSHAKPAAAESEGAWWLAAVGASLVYTPVKLLTAATGALLGVGAWFALGGDDEAAEEIILPAVGGDYWVEPDHLQGERHLDFMAG